MKFELFSRLYDEAKCYTDVDMYIADRGWQEWMNNYAEDSIAKMLFRIYELAQMEISELRKDMGLSRAQFCRFYGFPEATVRTWESREPMDVPENVKPIKKLIAYIVFMNGDHG